MKCQACGAADGVRLYGVCVDGDPLRLQVPLCADHGEGFLLGVGEFMGGLLRQTGGSSPAGQTPAEMFSREEVDRRLHERPLLNKSGGSLRHADGSECRDYSIIEGEAVCRHRVNKSGGSHSHCACTRLNVPDIRIWQCTCGHAVGEHDQMTGMCRQSANACEEHRR